MVAVSWLKHSIANDIICTDKYSYSLIHPHAVSLPYLSSLCELRLFIKNTMTRIRRRRITMMIQKNYYKYYNSIISTRTAGLEHWVLQWVLEVKNMSLDNSLLIHTIVLCLNGNNRGKRYICTIIGFSTFASRLSHLIM